MTQYKTLNVTLSNSKLNKLKSGIKNGTGFTLNLSSNLFRISNDETNFPHKLLLTDIQISTICKAFANGLSAKSKFWKTQVSKMMSRGFLFSVPCNTKKIEEKIIKKIKGDRITPTINEIKIL